MQIVTAHMIKEEGTYMRDYVIDPQGRIESLAFTNVKNVRGQRLPLDLPDKMDNV